MRACGRDLAAAKEGDATVAEVVKKVRAFAAKAGNEEYAKAIARYVDAMKKLK